MDIYCIPDTQVKDRVDVSYLKSIAKHIAEVKPDYIIHLGDHHDMPSCSYYDKGKKSHEIYNYIDDINAGNDASYLFFKMLDLHWPQHKKKCKKIMLRGNHEDRINRAYDYGDVNLREVIKRFPINDYQWKVIPFLKEFKLAGCYFSHFFPNENSGKPVGTARQLLLKKHRTCIAGHQQGFDYAEQLAGDGKRIHAIIAGSCYLHDEAYKGPNNHHFRGTFILRNVKNGMFDIERFGLQNLMRKYKP